MRRALPGLAVALISCTGSISVPPGPGDGLPPPDGSNACETGRLSGAPIPMRRLNRVHVEQTVRTVLGVSEPLPVADERLFTYRSNVSSPVDGAIVQAYFDYAEKVVSLAPLSRCTPSLCRAWLLDEVAPQLFRRPLEGEQRERYEELYIAGRASGGTEAEGARWVLEAMLQSPSFLYLDEPVDGRGYLDGYGVASRLSLMLWGENPDPTLLDLAARGRLSTRTGVIAVVQRMMDDPKSAQGFEAFVGQWLDTERLRQTDARPDLAALGAPTLASLEREPVEVFRLAALSGGGLAQLLQSPRTVPLPGLPRIYGADVLSTANGISELDPARRAGLLTLPGVMASLAHADSTSPTLRGYAVMANLLCKPPQPPPAGVIVVLPPPMPGATTRERLSLHFSAESCGSCHRSMDGMGFAFEHYDPLGRWRDLEEGKPIDDSSQFKLAGEDVTVHGAMELSQLLAGRGEVAECFARQWTRYATGIPEQAGVGCFIQQLSDGVLGPRGLETLVVELASSDYVRKGNTR